MARTFTTSDLTPGALRSETIAVLGFGNQGAAHALNLRDSGAKVVVGAREGGKGYDHAVKLGFEALSLGDAAARASLIVLSLPDMLIGKLFEEEVRASLQPGAALLLVHGFALRFGYLKPPEGHDVMLVSPKGPGAALRAAFENGGGLAALVAIHHDASGKALSRALGYAEGLGAFRSLVLETTIAEETDCDLFGEQVVLCGGMIELAKAAFDTLVEAGYSPEMAYFECVHEISLITKLLLERGLAGMREAISDTAEFGGYLSGPRLVDERTKAQMRQILKEIQSGEFAREFVAEMDRGGKHLVAFRGMESKHGINAAGDTIRPLLG